jgi:hypothetical protein
MVRGLAIIPALGAVLGACADDGMIDKPAACGLGTSAALSIVDRQIVGPAAPYPADLGLRAREAELSASPAARRAAAWQVVGRVLAPVPLAEPALAGRFGGQPTVPAWHTWYARDDFARVFQRLYGQLGAGGRRARAPFGDDAIGAALDWNRRAVGELEEWPEERYLAYLDAIDTPAEVGGVAGAHRVGYSPGATRHLLAGYARTHACRTGGVPAPWVDEPTRPPRAVERRETVRVDTCGWVELGPYLVADGEAIDVTSAGGGDADLYVRRGERPTVASHDCRSSGGDSAERCTVRGGGPVYVGLFAAAAAEVTVEVGYVEADARDPACVDGELPADAVLVKAEWRRAQFGAALPTYDTSPARMASRLRADGAAAWGPGDGQADPGPDDIYTVTTPDGATFRLAGLHIVSKELEHWLWTTLWWSPEPDTDFGADRPAGIGGPWRHYKMCVATDFAEADGAPSWCSNPYLEAGDGNAATNCIGCHQHGGTALAAEDILGDDRAFPHRGTTRIRNNFATDYLWAVSGGSGDDLASVVQAEIDRWDSIDP